MFQNLLNQNGQSVFNNPNRGNQPSKKIIIFGGIGLVIILILVAMLFFGGSGGHKNSKAWQDLVNNEAQILIVANKYNQDLTDSNLQNATATITLTWQTNNTNMSKIYATDLGKAAIPPSPILYKSLGTDLDTAKTAGNLDSVFASSMIKQLSLVRSNVKTIINDGSLGPKSKTQFQNTAKLTDDTVKLLQPFTNISSN